MSQLPSAGRLSQLRSLDVFTESWMQLSSRPGRTIMTAVGVALGSAAVVVTASLTTTIRYQVSDQFDALRATQIEVRPTENIDGTSAPFSLNSVQTNQLENLNGVVGVAMIRQAHGDQVVSRTRHHNPLDVPILTPVMGITAGSLDVLDADYVGPGWDSWHDATAARVVAVPERLVQRLGGPSLELGDSIFINDLSYLVVAFIEEVERLEALTSALLIPVSALDAFLIDTERNRIVVVTEPGAADQVAAVASLALDPTTPHQWTAYAPVRDETVRREVDNQLQVLSLGLGGIVLLLGTVSIGNSTLTSVLQRLHEIGLRRALGARPVHIGVHVVVDAAFTGMIGAAVGVLLGTSATLIVTAIQGWQPIIEPWLPVAVIVGGGALGLLAGLYPASVGSRLTPTDALRRE